MSKDRISILWIVLQLILAWCVICLMGCDTPEDEGEIPWIDGFYDTQITLEYVTAAGLRDVDVADIIVEVDQSRSDNTGIYYPYGHKFYVTEDGCLLFHDQWIYGTYFDEYITIIATTRGYISPEYGGQYYRQVDYYFDYFDIEHRTHYSRAWHYYTFTPFERLQ